MASVADGLWLHDVDMNMITILIGLFFLVAGTYTGVESIIESYADGCIFTYASNGL
jgi:hypothetical protein